MGVAPLPHRRGRFRVWGLGFCPPAASQGGGCWRHSEEDAASFWWPEHNNYTTHW